MDKKYRRMVKAMREKENPPGKTGTGGSWFLYILRCNDGTFYTGIAKDLTRRLAMHEKGEAARYTRTRRPVTFCYAEELPGRSEALARECRVKALTRRQKEELIAEKALRGLLDQARPGNSVYLSAPVNALVRGLYEENTSIAEIKRHGDFGLGTFNNLDGEMMILDGLVYQTKADGLVRPVEDAVLTPFACVTFFSPDSTEEIDGKLLAKPLNELLNHLIPSENMLYAIRIEGRFSRVATRSVPKQENYRPLAEAARGQPLFKFKQVEGTMAGFYTPEFMGSLNVPGYHLHFLTSDHTGGGHLLKCRLEKARISLQHIPKLELGLPVTLDYLTADLTGDVRKDLEEAEN